jgi:hypothetical protein
MTFDPLVYYGILLLAIAVTALTIVVFGVIKPRLGAAYALWALVVGGGSALAAHLNLLTDFDSVPPPFAIAALIFFAGPIALAKTRVGRTAADVIPLQLLVLMQAFRLPLELVMNHAADAGIMPEQLSFSGFNYDIITGATALILGVAMILNPTLNLRWVKLWNLWGSLCLIVIAFIAISSSPMLMRFGTAPHQVNRWVLHFPYVLLPALLVTNAIFTHAVIFRILNRKDLESMHERSSAPASPD